MAGTIKWQSIKHANCILQKEPVALMVIRQEHMWAILCTARAWQLRRVETEVQNRSWFLVVQVPHLLQVMSTLD